MKTNLIIIFIILISVQLHLLAQCGCMSSIMPGLLSSTTSGQIGVLRKGYTLIGLTGFYNYGNKEFNGNKIVPNSTVLEFNSATLSTNFSHGITNRLSIDLSLNAVLYNKVKTRLFEFENRGLNNIITSAKYNLIYIPKQNLEISLYSGFGIPLTRIEDTTYLYLQPTTGAFSVHTGLFSFVNVYNNLAAIVSINYNHNFTNSIDYQFGHSLATTMQITFNFIESVLIGIESTYTTKSKDQFQNRIQENSGFVQLSIAPSLSFLSKNILINTKIDYPLYRNYYGSQISKKFTYQLNSQIIF